jgi:hypothetical protein
MKDYLKDYLVGRRREEFHAQSKGNEVPKVTEDPFEGSKTAFGSFGTCQGVGYAENSEAQPAANPTNDSEINWRVAAMLSQIPTVEPISFLVAKPNCKSEDEFCLSCGDPLNHVDANRCAACGRAANLAIELTMSRDHNGLSDRQEVCEETVKN